MLKVRSTAPSSLHLHNLLPSQAFAGFKLGEVGADWLCVQSPLGSLFDARSMLADTSGAGNNWAHGHHMYGPQYREQIMQLVRQEVEQCDSPQGFLLTHSLGGGTGSGLGTYLLSLLQVPPQTWYWSNSLNFLSRITRLPTFRLLKLCRICIRTFFAFQCHCFHQRMMTL